MSHPFHAEGLVNTYMVFPPPRIKEGPLTWTFIKHLLRLGMGKPGFINFPDICTKWMQSVPTGVWTQFEDFIYCTSNCRTNCTLLLLLNLVLFLLCVCVCVYIYIYTHTHTSYRIFFVSSFPVVSKLSLLGMYFILGTTKIFHILCI